MSVPKLKEMGSENLLYQTDPNWVFGLEDANHQFGIVYEITNMADATGEEEYEDYPFLVSAEIMAHKCHKSFDEQGFSGKECEGRADIESLRYDCKQYMGGVPIDHFLSLGVKNGNDEGDAFEILAKNFTPFEAKIVTRKPTFGTWAAQNGPKTPIRYLQFKTEAAATKYVMLLAERAVCMSMMIGFLLDRPINMMGDSGWSVVEKQVRGCK